MIINSIFILIWHFFLSTAKVKHMLIFFFLFFQSCFDILKIHSIKMNLMRGIDLKKIAEKMNGASGAELKVY